MMTRDPIRYLNTHHTNHLMLGRLKKEHFAALFFTIPFLTLLWRAPDLYFYLASADHGYQLSLGRQILHGKFPFVDLFFHYGPLTAFTSAFGLWISNSLIPETIISALGYAISIFLIHYLTDRYGSKVAGIIAPLLGLILLSRFYKWYYWLFPLLILYCLHNFLNNSKPHQQYRWLFIAGILGSLGGLYRLDLGIAFVCFFLIILLSFNLKPRKLRLFSQQAAVFMAGFSLPLLGWAVILGLNGGTFIGYLDAILTGARGDVAYGWLPMPTFEWSSPLSPQSSAALAFLLLPLTYVLCLLYGFWVEIRYAGQAGVKYKFMMATGLLGLGIAPQAFHRTDIFHLLQVLPPALIGGSVLASELWPARILSKKNSQPRLLLKGLSICYLALVAISCWGIRDYGGSDLSGWAWNPLPRYRQLGQGIQSGINHPFVHLIAELQRQTNEDDRILVVPYATQLYFFSDRPISGFLVMLAPGFLNTERWRHRNLKAIRQDPPKIIIVDRPNLLPNSIIRKARPELDQFLSTTYTRVLYEEDGWLLITR